MPEPVIPVTTLFPLTVKCERLNRQNWQMTFFTADGRRAGALKYPGYLSRWGLRRAEKVANANLAKFGTGGEK